MLSEISKDAKSHFEGVLNALRKELSLIRTTRASPSLLEDLPVEVYEGNFTLKELATITAPQPNQILVSPFDPSIVYKIEKAIRTAPLGFNPVTEDNLIRVLLPEISGERRQELVKFIHVKAEEARVAVRRIRQDKIQAAEELEGVGKISEDEEQRFKKELQKMVEEYNEKIEALKMSKEKELLEA